MPLPHETTISTDGIKTSAERLALFESDPKLLYDLNGARVVVSVTLDMNHKNYAGLQHNEQQIRQALEDVSVEGVGQDAKRWYWVRGVKTIDIHSGEKK